MPSPGAHGGDANRMAIALGLDPAQMLDLSASMNPSAPDVVAVVRALLDTDPYAITRYPDQAPAEARLAGAIEVDPARLVLTNGGAEAIALVAAELGAGHVEEPEFSLYRRHLARLDPHAGRWRSNPSNPLGRLAAADDRAEVWDEAVHPLATGRWTRGDDDTWRLGSLTKLWACPGLRIGYAIAPDAALAERLRRRRPQWSVNGLALGVMPELLAMTDLAMWSSQIVRLREQFVAELRAMGFATETTDVNWVLVHGPGLRNHLAPLGLVVRDCTSFGLADVHRVAVPRQQDLDRVVAAFGVAASRR